MKSRSRCPECDSDNLFRSRPVSAGGGYAPNYLDGLGNFLTAAKFTLVVCESCGLTRFFASPEARGKLRESKKWSKA